MKKQIFKGLLFLNKKLLPSLTKRRVNLSKAKKWELALFGYKLWVLKHALD
jgi:hypothetical protein